MLISIYWKYLHYFERPCSQGMAKKTWRHERIILCICDQQVSFWRIIFSPPNKIFPVRRWSFSAKWSSTPSWNNYNNESVDCRCFPNIDCNKVVFFKGCWLLNACSYECFSRTSHINKECEPIHFQSISDFEFALSAGIRTVWKWFVYSGDCDILLPSKLVHWDD